MIGSFLSFILIILSFLYRDENAPQKIPDPDAVKPEGWLDDGPETIPDPDARQPDDWSVSL